MVRLHLILKKRWYALIDSGYKKEEYRALSDYWRKRFVNGQIKIAGKLFKPSEIFITFQLGYAADAPRMHFQCKGLRIATGRTEWGAIPNKKYHVLELGQRLCITKGPQ